MLNHIVLMGRLTRDPELRRTGSGVAVASFTLAVDRDYAAQGGEGNRFRGSSHGAIPLSSSASISPRAVWLS